MIGLIEFVHCCLMNRIRRQDAETPNAMLPEWKTSQIRVEDSVVSFLFEILGVLNALNGII